jgi:DNA invertase Pin-like site-specific DNA recombinase
MGARLRTRQGQGGGLPQEGKWTGGTVPLGYEATDKKPVVNKTEAQIVRTIFQLYLEVRSFGKLVGELDRRRIVTRRRNTKVAKVRPSKVMERSSSAFCAHTSNEVVPAGMKYCRRE